jgi:C-terminal processing protease CtpA/Prc
VTLAKRLVTIPTVSQTAVLNAGSSRVGYIHFRNFVQPSVEALNTAFAQIRDAGATELVLDLRYNGGGLVSVAQHLAGLIGGPPLVGQVFVQFTHNDKQSSRNTSYKLEAKSQALGVTRLVVITTRASASASEAIVNGLRPYMDVKVVGDTTYGKPVGQYGFDFCEKVLYPVAFLVTNARGQADYFGGIPADCAAADDVDHPLADPREASLAEALYVVGNGRCSGTAAAQAEIHARFRERVLEIPLDGWRRTLNAW